MKTWQRCKAAWAALTLTEEAAAPAPAREPDNAAELARLRLDLLAREQEIGKLREEFARQEIQAADAVRAAAGEAVSGLMRSLTPILSQLGTLRHMAGSGREVRAADALKLCERLEQALQQQGLERIGEVGSEAAFDPAIHQRMSGGDVTDGARVRVRFVGYRFRGETPVKAMVSRVGKEGEGAHETHELPRN